MEVRMATAYSLAKGVRDRSGRLAIATELVVVLGLLGVSLAALPVTQVVHSGVAEHALMLLRMVALLAAATWLLRRTGRSWTDVGLRRPGSWWRVAGLVVLGYAVLGALLQVLLPYLLTPTGAQPPALSAFTQLRGDLLQYLFFALPVSWGTAAFIEEMFARGYLLNRIVDLVGSNRSVVWWTAAAAQGLLFGLGHAYQGAGGVIMTGLIGVVFGAIYLLGSRNLWACIILHGIVDFVTVTAFFMGAAG
jgi:membrane protease YdiL (CAAX protease family)